VLRGALGALPVQILKSGTLVTGRGPDPWARWKPLGRARRRFPITHVAATAPGHRGRASAVAAISTGYPTEENGDTVALHPLDLEAAEGEVLG
jgi:hypothetical protein